MKRFKGIIFSLSFILLFLFGLNFILTANENNDKEYTLKITTHFDENEKITNQVVVKDGSKLSLAENLVNYEEYEFSFWLVDGFIQDEAFTDEFTVNRNLHLTLIYKPVNKNVVLFMDDDFGLLNLQYVLHGENATEPNITYPNKPGYKVSKNKWNKSLNNINQDTIIKLVYELVDEGELTEAYVYYIDVGSTRGRAGEAALIKVGNIEVLVDAGDSDSNSRNALLSFLNETVIDDTIEYVIATHPDRDHIGGMEIVYENFTVENTILYSTTNNNPTQISQRFVDIALEESEEVYYIYDIVKNNHIIELEEGYFLKFYDTNYLTSSNNNASSIVFTFEAFDTRILFNGDAESNQEKNYAPLVGDVDIFKLGHHGSSNGTSTLLLEHIKPEVAIVTNGDYLGNQYKHPTYEAVARIYEYSNLIPVYAVTGGNGSGSDRFYQRNGHITVTINSDGYEIHSEYYQDNPIELSATDYWKSSNNPYRDLGYYYADATGLLNKDELRQALHNIIKGHQGISYDDVKDAFKITEEDPNNPKNVLLLYTGYSQSKDTFGGNKGQYNREHVWPNSHGIHKKGPAYSDLHHLRATNVTVNSTRGNLDFGISITRTKVSANYGPNSSYSYIDYGSLFEPRDEVKGDVARMLFYMDIRYEGTNGEPDLKLVNGKTSNNTKLLGDLKTLLQWHLDDPVDDWERTRNDKVYGIQKNRNPFIDIPKFALIIFSQ